MTLTYNTHEKLYSINLNHQDSSNSRTLQKLVSLSDVLNNSPKGVLTDEEKQEVLAGFRRNLIRMRMLSDSRSPSDQRPVAKQDRQQNLLRKHWLERRNR